MARASGWVKLESDEFRRPRTGTGADVLFNVFLSPYDLPEAVRGRYDDTAKRFVVEFKYIAEEDRLLKAIDEYVSLSLGRNSGRLQEISVDVDAMKVNSVGLQMHLPALVQGAIERLVKQSNAPAREENYRIAKDVINSRKAQIFETLDAVR